jgi:hypothetical protein
MAATGVSGLADGSGVRDDLVRTDADALYIDLRLVRSAEQSTTKTHPQHP